MRQGRRAPISYRDAGVDVAGGDAFVDRIRPIAARTARPGCIEGLGGFGALFQLDTASMSDPVLVSSTDGVGTKLKLAFALDRHDTVGIDLVAMCANDVVVQGAEPLFFLDYLACARLRPEVAEAVVAGIGTGCEAAGAALIGGETAEMPDMYAEGEYDLAGFCVGAVDRPQLLDGSAVRAGDVLVGLASSGLHSNGFSLIRRLLDEEDIGLDLPFDGATLGDELMKPTRIYARALLPLVGSGPLHGLAHITGGGLPGNVERLLPAGLQAMIDTAALPRLAIYDWLRETERIEPAEMRRAFNCGVGMVAAVEAQEAPEVMARLRQAGEDARAIGRIQDRAAGTHPVVFDDES